MDIDTAVTKKQSWVRGEGTGATRSDDAIVTSIPGVPVTGQRKPFNNPELENVLPQPGVARANLAPSVASPNGTTEDDWAAKHSNQSVLQQHLDFFDTDHDMVIWPFDTFHGFYRLGFGAFFSFLFMIAIHFLLSYPTVSTILPDPFFRIFLRNIHKTKHGSDSGVYDNEGRFVPQKFEDVFSKYAGGKTYVTYLDILRMLNGQRLLLDPVGAGAAFGEWTATYIMLWPKDGQIKKEEVRRMYDGSLFHVVAERYARKSASKTDLE